MEQQSPFLLIKQLEAQLNGALSAFDLFSLPAGQRKTITTLRRELTDARLDVRDYELSETRDEQLKNAKVAKKRLDQVRRHILAASEFNVFGPVDVAQLTAQAEQISDNVR
ncbi:MAG TPA: hypothetical protein VHD60_01325 [Candidatus Saccharimonadales bacterium]|nr:hypothetical protein [Candidatus Saccharimonadales bacterium]